MVWMAFLTALPALLPVWVDLLVDVDMMWFGG
jgi:hypothetical protein